MSRREQRPQTPPLSDAPVLSVSALSMQILKPAAFAGTSHYPLLLLV